MTTRQTSVARVIAAISCVLVAWAVAAAPIEPDQNGMGGTGHQAGRPTVPETIMPPIVPPAAELPVIVTPPMVTAPATPAVDGPSVPAATTVAPLPSRP